MAERKGGRRRRERTRREDKAQVEIQRLWGDLPVVDARKELRVMILPEDRQGARVKDPAECIFARACKRLFKASKVLFFRSIAYVELPDREGKHHVERFFMDEDMRSLVDSFDRGLGTIPEAGFVLKPPTMGQRLGVDREKRREAGQRYRDRRKLEGTRKGRHGGQYRDKPVVLDLAVRSGQGAVHFTTPKPEEES